MSVGREHIAGLQAALELVAKIGPDIVWQALVDLIELAMVEPEPVQGEAAQSDKWLQDWARDKFTYTGKWRGSVYGSTDWAVARAMHASMMAAAKPDASPAYWQWRHYDNQWGWSAWEIVTPTNAHAGQTVETMLDDYRAYIARGKRYELRALYASPAKPDDELVRQCIAEELATWEGDFQGPVHTAMSCLQVRIDAALSKLTP